MSTVCLRTKKKKDMKETDRQRQIAMETETGTERRTKSERRVCVPS